MTSVEFTSEELRDMADQAPPNTLEEDVEKMYHRDVGELQREFYDEIYRLIEGVDDAVMRAMQNFGLDEETARQRISELLDDRFAKMRVQLNGAVEALRVLRDDRIAEIAQWRLNSEECPPGSDTQ